MRTVEIADDLRDDLLKNTDPAKPVVMINLLRFREKPEYAADLPAMPPRR